MIAKLKEYAKGVIAGLGLVATVLTTTLPTSHTAQLYAAASAAIATLVSVISIPNASPKLELTALEGVLSSVGSIPQLHNVVHTIEPETLKVLSRLLGVTTPAAPAGITITVPPSTLTPATLDKLGAPTDAEPAIPDPPATPAPAPAEPAPSDVPPLVGV